MSPTSSRLLRALRDLGLALINATLLLAALCLFLGLRLADRVETVSQTLATTVTRTVAELEPLGGEVRQVSAELSGLREDLAALRANAGTLPPDAVNALADRLDARMAKLDETLGGMRTRLDAVEIDPQALADHVIETAAVEMAEAIGGLAGCALPRKEGLETNVPPAQDAGGT